MRTPILKTYDTVIIGAGLVGCSIALSLSRAGLRTLNIDPNPAPGYGSTSHSSAIIRPFYSHITSCAIAHESRHRWLNWADFLQNEDPQGTAHYSETGGTVLVKAGEEHVFAQNLAALDAVGVDYHWLSREELVHRHPNISLACYGPPKLLQDPTFGEVTSGEITGGIYIPACGHVSDPQLAAHNLYHAAITAGASFEFGVPVTEIRKQAERVIGVTLNNGRQIDAAGVVNAAGPHSSQINELAGIVDKLAIKTQPHRHEVAFIKAPADVQNNNGFVIDLDSGVYQRNDGADLLVGSADPDCDTPEIVDPDNYSEAFSEQWTVQVYRAAQRFPELAIESKARGTVGLYDVSDDWIPVYDKTDNPGYYLAIGTSGNQFKNAPLIGDIMTAIITTGMLGIDHDTQPASLALPALQRQVELSFYSRRREIQATHSVMA